jgi:hypothetical protein
VVAVPVEMGVSSAGTSGPLFGVPTFRGLSVSIVILAAPGSLAPTTATMIAWLNWIGTGVTKRSALSHTITSAKTTSSTALAKAASELTFPVPKLKRASFACRLV